MAELFTDLNCLWIVEEFYDAIRKKTVKAVRKDEEFRQKWGRGKALIFNSEQEAQHFVIERKGRQIEAARAEVKDLERKLKALKKKFKRD